jgi:hypothetical protein
MPKKTTAAQTAPKKEAATETQTIEQTEAMQAATAGYTEDQVQKMIAKAVAEALAAQPKPEAAAPAIPAANEVVTMRFFDEVNDRNVVYLGKDGKYGQIIGKRWTGQIPKLAFIGDFRTPQIQRLLADRNLIVLDGLTEEERRLYGVEYAEGEFIDEKLYGRLTRMGEDELLATYKALCPEWRRMIAIRFADAFEDKTLKVTRDALLALNKISRKDNKDLPKDDIRRKGAFWPIIQKLNFAEDSDIE